MTFPLTTTQTMACPNPPLATHAHTYLKMAMYLETFI